MVDLNKYKDPTTLFRSYHLSPNADVVNCVWVKKYYALYLSSENLDVILLFLFRLYLNHLILLVLICPTNLHLSAYFLLQANIFHPSKLGKRAVRRETWLWPDVRITSCIILIIRWPVISFKAHFIWHILLVGEAILDLIVIIWLT